MTNQLVSLRSEWLRLLTHDAFNTGLDFFFPPRCVGCGCAGSLFCSDCHAEIIIPEPPLEWDSALDALRGSAVYENPIRQAIHDLKFNGVRRMAQALGDRLVKVIREAGWQFTVITAVPLHPSRLQERGYNQSELLAQAVARRMGLLRRFHPHALSKHRLTAPQVGLNGAERQINVRGAFTANETLVTNQSVVIVDDVYTTGATLGECAFALRQAGAAQVWGLTVAIVADPQRKETPIETQRQA